MLLLVMVMIVLVEERKGPPWKGTHGHRVNRKPELRLGELNFGMQRRQISAQKNLMEIEEGEQLDRIPVCTTVSIPVRQMLAYSAEESLSLPLSRPAKRDTRWGCNLLHCARVQRQLSCAKISGLAHY